MDLRAITMEFREERRGEGGERRHLPTRNWVLAVCFFISLHRCTQTYRLRTHSIWLNSVVSPVSSMALSGLKFFL